MTFPTLTEIIQSLQARPEDVARTYAPGGRVQGGRYWALDPGRQDGRIGSFYVGLNGDWAGRWRDEVTGEMGDMLDLIQRALDLTKGAAVEEAKRYLGIGHESAQQRALRLRQNERALAAQALRAKLDTEKRAKRQRDAHGLFLASHERIYDTPVQFYLAARAIRLDQLGRSPHTLRYHPALRYYMRDKDTGEVIEGEYPAMVAAIYSGWAEGERPRFIGIHKTYLAKRADGIWGKAPVPKPKLLWGAKKGGYIRLWAGQGVRGGKGLPLSRAPLGSKLYITEGIEDGLSVAMLDRTRRVACAIDLGNIREMRLPPNIRDVVLVADNDPKPEQVQQIERAVDVFVAQGRTVRVWKNNYGGKDINDALVAAVQADEGAA